MSFDIKLQPANRNFPVMHDEPILTAAIRQGIGMPYGCRDGACGSCKSRLLSGRVVHGPHQLKALSPSEEADGFILPCCAIAQTDCVIEARSVPGAGEFPILKMPARVMSLQRAASDVMIMRLQLPANQNLRYRAGQYIEIILRDGTRRSYSMASTMHDLGVPPALELHLRHMIGGVFTDHVFDAMQEKEILRIEGPYGSFFLREDSQAPIVLLAGGTGFAPIKAMLMHMWRQAVSRPTRLYWGCRSRADLYLHDWALQIAEQMPQLHYVPVLSDAAAADGWDGRRGLVHEAVMADLADLSAHQVYACGAPAMVEAAQRDFVQRRGLPDEQFFADAFTSEADKA